MTKNTIRGRKAQQQGAAFEALFLAACTHKGIVCTRIPDGCKQLPGGKLRRIKTPFDWVLSYRNHRALIDTKSIDKETFPHSLIEPHQALTLVRHESQGDVAGYVVWLKKADQIIYIPAKTLCIAMQRTGSIGLDHPEIIKLGTPLKDLDLKRLFETIQP